MRGMATWLRCVQIYEGYGYLVMVCVFLIFALLLVGEAQQYYKATRETKELVFRWRRQV